mgnify:CR=1 FL=1
MNIIFYDELIDIRPVLEEIALLPLSDKDEQALLSQIDQIFHHEILDEILTQLPREAHEEFFVLYGRDPGDVAIWDYLGTHVPTIRDDVRERSDRVQGELRAVIVGELKNN